MKNYFFPALTNYSPGANGQTLANDIQLVIQKEVLRFAQRNLVAYGFGQSLKIDKQHGITYTATRFERLPLPFAPLSEGVPAAGGAVTIAQVSAQAQQWGDLVRVTDVADMTIKHPLFQQAIRLIGVQQQETVERNTLTALLSATQVNYVGNNTSRGALAAANVLSPVEISKVVGSLRTFGAPEFNGDEREDMKSDPNAKRNASAKPGSKSHYVALVHPLVEMDLLQNSTIVTAFSYSDLNKLYNSELGEWGGVRFCRSNMIPFWTGAAAITGTPVGTGGTFAAGTYYVQVTAAPASTSVEQVIYQASTSITVAANGSISVTLPTKQGFVFNVYVGTSAVPSNLALSSAGPLTGPLAGQAAQLNGGTTVVLTGVGVAQTPPAAPATGVTVYPTIVMGTDAYGIVSLDDVKYSYLSAAEKSDPHNQTRVVSWKMMYGTIILNNAYMARIESGSQFAPGYAAGTALVG
jgi:N4-gp56 family major capsid protein